MSTFVEINGINFLPIKDAAKSFSYTRDYVARLAREQKIVATQIGRQWFIDPVSLKSFVEAAVMEQSVRKQQLSLQRKKEQLVKYEVNLLKKEKSTKTNSLKLHAQLVSVFVLAVGLMAGATIYTTTSVFQSQSANVAILASESAAIISDSVAPISTNEYNLAEPQATAMFNNVSQYPVFIDESETRAMSIGNAEGIFLVAKDSEVKSSEQIQAMFSDEIEVGFSSDSTGVVTYKNDEGLEAEYPFISVPSAKTQKIVIKEVI